MTSANLPADIVARVEVLAGTTAPARLIVAHADMSAVYRSGGSSSVAVADPAAALAYATARMPATYAACVRAFDLVGLQAPNFAPNSAIDFGAGPGTALLAAADVWPSVRQVTAVEPNGRLARLAEDLCGIRFGRSTILAKSIGDASDIGTADLVILSYVLAEHSVEASKALVDRAAATASEMIVIVEPGTPAGYARVIAAREAFIARGLTILAPCPHERGCPLPAGDWCHFSVRLQRTAAHKRLKGAEVPYEDERFGFVAAARSGGVQPAAARLIRAPATEKGFVDLDLCTTTGLERVRVPRREKDAYKRARKSEWGDPR